MIEAKGLTKRFDGFTAVDEVTLSVGHGELLALLGPNGAGKTTTVRMLSAILDPPRAMPKSMATTSSPMPIRSVVKSACWPNNPAYTPVPAVWNT
jgi:ABC-type branched-subunit amino acid transport system ATPase component